MNVAENLQAGTRDLVQAGIAGAARDARILLSHVLDTEPSRLALIANEPVGSENEQRFTEMILQRCQFRPVSQLIGCRNFWGRDFKVTKDVLDPRPETETIIALALEHAPPKRILDLGTGSGILALTLLCEFPDARAFATDISEAALDVARYNADRLGVADRMTFIASDWFQSVEGQFDLIVSNPPYITAQEMTELQPDVAKWEPGMALFGGDDGLEHYRKINAQLRNHLHRSGYAMFEHGHLQGGQVQEVFENWCSRQQQDMNGHDRILVVEYPTSSTSP